MRPLYKKGFTIVEVIIVIVIIAILSSIVSIAYNSVLQDSRDTARESNALTISEGLEKYYEKNGEYPSVPSIVSDSGNSGQEVAEKLSIPTESLVMPRMPEFTDNALTSDPTPEDDMIAYIAQSAEDNLACQSDANAGCDHFTLVYSQESTGEAKSIESRRGSRVAVSKPDLEVSATGVTAISATWTMMPDATGYELQRSTSSDMSSPVTTTHTGTSSIVSDLAINTEYFFRVRASLPSGASEWSDVQSATTSGFEAPTGTISISATLSGSNARGAASGGSCPTGATVQYQIRYLVNSGSYTSWTTGSPRDVAATQGYRYTFQAQARCFADGVGGPWKQSSTASVVRPVTAPSGLTISATMSGSNARGTAGGGSCPAGTTIERQIRYFVNSGSYVGWTTGTPRDVAATQGYRYTFQQQARCKGTHASSSWATSGTSSVIRPVSAPSGLTISATMSGSNARGTAGGGSCPAGTTITRQIRYYVNAGSWSAWSTRSSWDIAATSGYRYVFQQQARCTGSFANSGWVASGTATVVRPVAQPSTPTISASIVSTSYARGSAGGASCPSGTSTQRQIRYQRYSGSSGSWSAWSTRSSWDISAYQGWRHVFQQQARCVGQYANSGWRTSGTASAVRTITTKPTGGTTSNSTSGSNTTFRFNNVSGCPTGTTTLYTYRYISVPGGGYPPSWDAGHPSYNNPPHNWSSQLPASTAYRTFTWNTSARNRRYFVHFAAMCGTTHHTGPWMNSHINHEASYYRP